ncbi:MAG TPA: glycosyl hydrolase family 18 protein [Bacillota bacterium]
MIKHYLLLALIVLMLALTGCAPKSEMGIEKLYVAAWLWRDTGKVTFRNQVTLFDEINPVWYKVTATEAGTTITGAVDPEVLNLLNLAVSYGVRVKLLPTIQKLTRDTTTTNIIDDLNRSKHIALIVKLVTDNGFDGIDIDYEAEGLTTEDQKNFTVFIKELGLELRKINKKLSVCVYGLEAGLHKTWQKWAEMLDYVDTLKVMVYNCDLTDKQEPSPISPLTSLERTLRYAQSFPNGRDKIIIGLPFYGRHWALQSDGSPSKSTVRYTDPIITEGIKNYEILRDKGEPYFNYTDENGVEHTVYFQDYLALRERLELISRYPGTIKGIAFWDLGGEDPLNWNEVARYK